MSTTNPTDIISEWDEAHIKLGNYAPRPPQITGQQLTDAAIDFAEGQDPLARKTLAQLDRLEDEIEGDELQRYRERRLAELRRKKAAFRFGSLVHVGKADYVEEVTEASRRVPSLASAREGSGSDCDGRDCGGPRAAPAVVLTLHAPGHPPSAQLLPAMRALAARHGDVKFCEAVAADVMENAYPEARLPTVLVYRDGVCRTQFVGAAAIWGDGARGAHGKPAAAPHACTPEQVEATLRKKAHLFTEGEERGERANASESESESAPEDTRGYTSTTMEKALRLK